MQLQKEVQQELAQQRALTASLAQAEQDIRKAASACIQAVCSKAVLFCRCCSCHPLLSDNLMTQIGMEHCDSSYIHVCGHGQQHLGLLLTCRCAIACQMALSRQQVSTKCKLL